MNIKRIARNLIRTKWVDRKFRAPRIWSNNELLKFSGLFHGDIVNVSGWNDCDKQGGYYKSYFSRARSYSVTNFLPDQKGLTGREGEIFLDLEADLPEALNGSFDVVFNHTTLEHIFDVGKAMKNLCRMSRDIVIIVVPYIQQMHGVGYGDYWRFTPQTLKKMFEKEGYLLRYCSANGSDKASIYLFAIATRDDRWNAMIPERYDMALDPSKPLYGDRLANVIGGNVIN